MSKANAFLIGGSLLIGLAAVPALAQDAENGHIVFLNECYECHTTKLGGFTGWDQTCTGYSAGGSPPVTFRGIHRPSEH